ncbi:MAG: purine-nucleoside phosphorylase [Gemmatimonadaceae bacterium]|nr:purine-nucleoside phosphorylase [Gemmatimonadaceae bacterium]
MSAREQGPPVRDADILASSGAQAAGEAAAAVRRLAARELPAPAAVIVLGSGLGGLAQRIDDAVRIPFHDVPGFPMATVAGHAGALILGRLAARPVLCLAGRFHIYEGHAPQVAAFPVRVAHALGARTLVVSNAAGGIRRTFTPGTLMRIEDHINLMMRHPLAGPVQPGEARFPDMSRPYDAALASLAHAVAREQGTRLEVGVYCALTGPTYETPAEVRMLERLGADAVGMSTVPEVLVARALGMRVLGISCITNAAAGYTGQPLSHDEVIESTREAAGRFEALVEGVVARL